MGQHVSAYATDTRKMFASQFAAHRATTPRYKKVTSNVLYLLTENNGHTTNHCSTWAQYISTLLDGSEAPIIHQFPPSPPPNQPTKPPSAKAIPGVSGQIIKFYFHSVLATPKRGAPQAFALSA